MRRLALATIFLAAACSSTPDEPNRRTWSEDAEAERHVEAAVKAFADAEADPPRAKEAYERALAALESAVATQPSPEHRFARARVALLVEPEAKAPRDDLRAVVALAPELAVAQALLASIEAEEAQAAGRDTLAALARAEKACTIAASDSRAFVRCFVGEEAARATAYSKRKEAPRAVEIVALAAELGSPLALHDAARVFWAGYVVERKDRERALELARRAAFSSELTAEERARGWLAGVPLEARNAARFLGEALIELGRWKDARVALAKSLEPPFPALQGELLAPQAIPVVVELGALEAFGLGSTTDVLALDRAHGRSRLEHAARSGAVAALVLLGRTEPDRAIAREIFLKAKERESRGALACLGEWEELAKVASEEADKKPRSPEKLYLRRLACVALAVARGPAAREEVEKLARDTEGAPREKFFIARQLAHIAGELSAEELKATMPATGQTRWAAETELALAARRLVEGDKDGALRGFQECLAAHALLSIEDEVAWGALRTLLP